MLFFNLCGYVLDIFGVVYIIVKVIVSQMGCVIYEMQVLVGLFCIQDFGDFIFGMLYVCIEEQNGQVQEYDISIVLMLYFICLGQVCYKVMMGCL